MSVHERKLTDVAPSVVECTSFECVTGCSLKHDRGTSRRESVARPEASFSSTVVPVSGPLPTHCSRVSSISMIGSYESKLVYIGVHQSKLTSYATSSIIECAYSEVVVGSILKHTRGHNRLGVVGLMTHFSSAAVPVSGPLPVRCPWLAPTSVIGNYESLCEVTLAYTKASSLILPPALLNVPLPK